MKPKTRKLFSRLLSLFLTVTMLLTGLAPAGAEEILPRRNYLPPLFDPYDLAGPIGWQGMLPSPGGNLPDPTSVAHLHLPVRPERPGYPHREIRQHRHEVPHLRN